MVAHHGFGSQQDQLFGPVEEQLAFGVDERDERTDAQRSVDELLSEALMYRTTKGYAELLDFVRKFRQYAPFNAMLVHVQLPGARFVATASRWREAYQRRLRPGAKPLVILQPRAPVMFVYDVSDTEATDGARPLPPDVEDPFRVSWSMPVSGALQRTMENAKRDGIRVTEVPSGSQAAGEIRTSRDSSTVRVTTRRGKEPEYTQVPVRYEMQLNQGHGEQIRYATLCHELAHLYCDHLGTPNEKWWPDRRRVSEGSGELEAESAAFIVARRRDSSVQFPPYLTTVLEGQPEVPT
jgi:hypothetical protein